MTYTEIKERNGKKYFYRVKSVRRGKKVSKEREYLGVDLSKKELLLKEKKADKNLQVSKKENESQMFKKIKSKIKKILKKNKIKKAGIFGSYVRGDQRKNSDIDILIEFNGSLLALVKLERELGENLGKKIDLLTYAGIHPLLKKRILSEEVKII